MATAKTTAPAAPAPTENTEGNAPVADLQWNDPVVPATLEPEAPAAVVSDVVTVEQAQAMFADNAGLAHVMTDQGMLARDGSYR